MTDRDILVMVLTFCVMSIGTVVGILAGSLIL
jgi:hypothetical protein